MKTDLNEKDMNVILESLKYSRLYIENYEYPEINPGDSNKLKQQKLNDINEAAIKISNMKNGAP
jgi:hypothetical protein